MTTRIQHRRSSTPGSIPTTGNLLPGEIAVNLADGKLFTNNGTAIIELGNGTGPSPSPSPTLVVANFGTGAGKSALRLAVADTNITATSRVEAWLHGSTVDHNEEEHAFIPIRIAAINRNAGVGFTLFISSELRLTGQLQIAYRIS